MTITPYTPMGENEPAVALWMMAWDKGSRLRWLHREKPSAIGMRVAAAAGVAAPIAVSSAVIPNITNGNQVACPPIARSPTLTIALTVPLFVASENRYVTPQQCAEQAEREARLDGGDGLAEQ